MKREMSDSDSEQDLLDDGCGSPMHHSGMDRKKRRGIIEKRRRDRINHSLTELKRLVPAAYEKQGSAKLEKAEILQMTVDHLKILQQHKGFTYPDPNAIAMDYRLIGFRECAGEVARYLLSVEGMDSHDPLRLRLLSHLQCFSHQRDSEMSNPRMSGTPTAPPQNAAGSVWMAAAATGGAQPGPTAATSVYAAPGHPHTGTTPATFVSDPLTQQPAPQMAQHPSANQLGQPQVTTTNKIAAPQHQQFAHHLQPHMTTSGLCANQAPSPNSNFGVIGQQHHMVTSAPSSAHMQHHNNNTSSAGISSSAGGQPPGFSIGQAHSPSHQYQPVAVLQGMNKPYRPWGTELGAY